MNTFVPQDAAQQAESAAAAYRHASRPSISRAVAALCALAAGVGTALLPQPWPGAWRLVVLALGLLLLAAAFAVPNLLRRRAGLRGYRGRAARDNTTYLGCGAALLACAANPAWFIAAVYALLGVVVALTWYGVLRRHRWADR